MKRLLCSLILLGLLLSSCSEDFPFEPGQVYLCQSVFFEGDTAYVVPDVFPDGTSANTGNVYVDKGLLHTSSFHASFGMRGEQLFFESKKYGTHDCALTPYDKPLYPSRHDSIDYKTKRFGCNKTPDLHYATVQGYWDSYPNDSCSSYIDIVSRKLGEIRKGPVETLNLSMDIYSPKVWHWGKRPLLLLLHDGAFFNGDKADIEYVRWAEDFAACGYITASVNYRLGFSPFALSMLKDSLRIIGAPSVLKPLEFVPKAKRLLACLFNDDIFKVEVEKASYRAMEDVKSALDYLIADAESLGIDTSRIYLAGCSAGAITALNVAFMTDDFRPASIPANPDSTGRNQYSIKALCNMWGAAFLPEMLQTSRKTSVLSIHSEKDPIVPYKNGVTFADLAKAMTDVRVYSGFLSQYATSLNFLLNVPKNWLIDIYSELLFPRLNGSYLIDSVAESLCMTHQLITEHFPAHTLVKHDSIVNVESGLFGSDTTRVKVLDLAKHSEYFNLMTDFFQKSMISRPVSLIHCSEQVIAIEDPADVKSCSWTVSGGVITDASNPFCVRVLLFDDDPTSKSVSVSGVYHSMIPFSQTINL